MGRAKSVETRTQGELVREGMLGACAAATRCMGLIARRMRMGISTRDETGTSRPACVWMQSGMRDEALTDFAGHYEYGIGMMRYISESD